MSRAKCFSYPTLLDQYVSSVAREGSSYDLSLHDFFPDNLHNVVLISTEGWDDVLGRPK
jgi:hypothetical protein